MKKILHKLKTLLADLRDISLHAALFAPILDQWHPGQPHLVEFVMRRPNSDNASGAVANITALAAAGYRASAEPVSELTGLDVEDTGAPDAAPSQGAGTGAAAAMLNSTRLGAHPQPHKSVLLRTTDTPFTSPKTLKLCRPSARGSSH